MTDIKNKLTSLFFPNHCICCDRLTPNEFFCKECNGLFAPIGVKTCEKCGLPLKICSCKWNFYYFDKVIARFKNDRSEKRSFYRFKFNSHISAGEYFAREMAELISNKYDDITFDFITSVPTHKKSVLDRGYDQTAILAKKIAKGLGLKYKKTLYQPSLTAKQHETKTISERYNNVKGKYRTLKNADLKGKTVLLIDDIKTTGATLSECARELKLSGTDKVYAAVSLITYPKEKNDK